MTSQWEWQFGGLLQTLPPTVAWGILGTVAIAGVALIVFLYRHTLRGISPSKQGFLAAFRVAMLVAVLICLANPGLVNHAEHKRDVRRRLAVVIDRSDSMNALDNRSETRLGNALRIWKQHIGEAKDHFDAVDYYRFSSKLDKGAGLEEVSQAKDPGPETRLYEALGRVLDDSPAAVVCLTDGLDTTGGDASRLVNQAQRQGVPVYFIAAKNRTRVGESLGIREIRTPARVLRHSQFAVGAVLEIVSAKESTVPVDLWSGDRKIASTKISAHAGWNVVPWTTEIPSGEPGAMPLEFRLGEGKAVQIAAGTTRVVEKNTVDVLFYQGALQWGYRFFLMALQSDPGFKVNSILNPSMHLQMTTVSAGDKPLADLPEDAALLKNFQVVVLAHVFADQLSDKQQQALADYVKGGGSVLFITSDTAASQQFAGTPLEKMLPIVFERSTPESAKFFAEESFQEHMRAIGGARPADETSFAEDVIKTRQASYLRPFAPPPKSGASKLFHPGNDAPRFAVYARVSEVKPGAEILAVHPVDRNPSGNAPRVLVARQRFGDGWTSVMTTDLLWRWKMSLPSDSRVVDTFWQQFILSLAPSSEGQGLRMVKMTDAPAVNHTVAIRVEGSSGGAPSIFAISPTGARKSIAPGRETGRDAGGAWRADFIPDTEGRWEVQATDMAGNNARITFDATAQVRNMESLNLPPDTEGLRHIAESSGGALIEDGCTIFHTQPPWDQTFEPMHAKPLWNNAWLIGALLGLYGIELISRRCFRLL